MSNKPVILVVDDAPVNIELITMILKDDTKYDFIYAYDGLDAIEKVKENDISLILLDIVMPKLGGFEVTKELKANPLYKDIPIIFTTAATDSDSIKTGFELGAADYITKPFNHVELVARVNTHIELFNSKKELKHKLNRNKTLLEQYKKVVDESDIVSKTDTRGYITYVNKKFIEISGYSEEELLGRSHNILRHPDMPQEAFAVMWATITAKKVWRGEVKNRKKDGSTYVVESTIVPILDIHGDIIEYMSIRHNITDIYNLKQEIEDTQKEVVYTLGTIGESRSRETANHVKRVAEYSYLLAKLYGLEESECALIRDASPMHDIGKVGIADDILKKPAKLTKEEFEVMKTHTKLGYDMLSYSKRAIFKTASIIAYEHHEKYDGSGYPNAKEGEDIHIYGRITALCDVFDALGSDRVYKKAWELDRILDLIQSESGKHFDPKLVNLFLDNLDDFLIIRDRLKDIF